VVTLPSTPQSNNCTFSWSDPPNASPVCSDSLMIWHGGIGIGYGQHVSVSFLQTYVVVNLAEWVPCWHLANDIRYIYAELTTNTLTGDFLHVNFFNAACWQDMIWWYLSRNQNQKPLSNWLTGDWKKNRHSHFIILGFSSHPFTGTWTYEPNLTQNHHRKIIKALGIGKQGGG